MNKLVIPTHLLDEIIDLIHISTGIEKTPELYDSIRAIIDKSQEKVALHFHISQRRL